MKIGIDISQVAYTGSGVARYVRNMILSLLEYDTENEYTFFFSSLRQTLDPMFAKEIEKKHKLVTVKLPASALDIMWNRVHAVPIENFIGNQDVVISSDWTQPPSRAKKMTVVHDLVYLRYPETLHPQIVSVQKRRMGWVKKEVDLIFADSQATKDDLITLLTVSEKKIHVLYPAVDVPPLRPRSEASRSPYILSVGKLEPRKNIAKLIEAFTTAKLPNTKLLIVGPKGWDSSIDSKRSENVEFLGFVSDEELYELYKSAEFFIYPSLYEGFGYPVVEAMSLGCPVATSNTSSLREIAEGFALLFDPNSVVEISYAITKLHTDPKLRAELIQKGKKRAADFTAKEFFPNFLQILKQ